MSKNFANNQKVITFVLSLKIKKMKKKTKERRDTEKELLYYLQIYNELKGRNEVERVLSCLGDEIDKLVEKLKFM